MTGEAIKNELLEALTDLTRHVERYVAKEVNLIEYLRAANAAIDEARTNAT